jgi:hypothetical protein
MRLPSIKGSKAKLLISISLVVVFCFVPLVNMPYDVIVQKEVPETYTTIEPYTVQEEVREPYTTYIYEWQESRYPGYTLYSKGRWITIPVTQYRTVYKDVTKYREVTKTRLVSRPVVETRTKRASILRYLLG